MRVGKSVGAREGTIVGGKPALFDVLEGLLVVLAILGVHLEERHHLRTGTGHKFGRVADGDVTWGCEVARTRRRWHLIVVT